MTALPVRPPPGRVKQLQQLSDWHREWVQRHLPTAPFNPAGRRDGSDYNQHYVDLEADDDEFHAHARQILGIPDPAGHAPDLSKAAHASALKLDEGEAGDYRARHLIRWYEHGKGAAEIAWGTPGDFDRCVAIAGEHMSEEKAKGFCNLRHHGALGIYPATHAAMERHAAGKALLADLAKMFDPAEPRGEDGRWAHSTGLVHSLLASLKDARSHGGIYFDDDDYVDWSTRTPDGYRLEVGNGDGDIQLDVSHDDMALLHDSLTRSLRDHHPDGFALGDDLHDNRSIEWEPLDKRGDRWQFDVTDSEGQSVSFQWPVNRIRDLHAQLTLQLLHDAIQPGGQGPNA